ncbi:unnamed protein product [Colias eurytheme]|nr:unnamed protein product [Colias eurytheme]
MAKVNKKKRAKDPKPKRFPCTECGKKFSEKGSLHHHLQLHSDDRPFTCNICNGTFKTNKYLMKHIKRVHNAPTDHECDFCGKKFHYKSLMEKHRVVHTDEKPYKCKWCKKGFNSGYSLSTHILIHTSKFIFI